MMERELAQNLLAARGEADVHLTPVFCTSAALDEVFFLKPGYQFDRAVMANLQAFSEIGYAGTVLAGGSTYGEHELVVLRLDSRLPGCFLAEMEKAPDLIAKIGQG